LGAAEPVLPCSGVGEDLLAAHAEFFERWNLDVAGLAARSARTPRTIVSYHPDGRRDERSLFGDAHFDSMTPRPDDLAETGATLIGLYTFQHSSSQQWPEIVALRRRTGCPVLWELSALDRGPIGWRRVAGLLSEVEVISLNIDEGEALTGSDDPREIIARFVSRGASIVIIRAGEHGSYVGSARHVIRLDTAPSGAIADPTGAGNTYSGAFLSAWVSTGSLELAGRTAAAAASFMLEQFGPPSSPPDAKELARRAAATRVEPAGSACAVAR
jgi:sugar/nucleoside kinase (ribokinase family)